VLSLVLLALWPVDATTAAGFIAGVAHESAHVAVAPMDWSQFLRALVPPNIFAAAADNAILALVVFATLLGFATTTRGAEHPPGSSLPSESYPRLRTSPTWICRAASGWPIVPAPRLSLIRAVQPHRHFRRYNSQPQSSIA